MASSSSRTSPVEAVLASLRRGQRQLRDPRGTIEAAVKQLLGARPTVGDEPADGQDREPAGSYRIDDLAQVTGTTVRNIRAYQERGLLHPARRVGRASVFDDTHVARLKIITSMLDRGYTSAHITEMLAAWESGSDLSAILGLEGALVGPDHLDTPTMTSLAEARDLAGGPEQLEAVMSAGLAEWAGNRIRILRPKLLHAFAEMREFGMSPETLLDIHLRIVPELERVADILVTAGAAHLGPRFLHADPPTSDDVDELVTMLTRFRTLTMSTVSATLATAIETRIEQLLSEYLAHYVRSGEDAG